MLYTQTGINCDKLSEIDQCPKYPSHMELSPVPLMPPNKQHLPLVQESRDFLTLLPPSISSLFSVSINPNCCILYTICHSSLTAQLICMLSGDVSYWHASRTILILFLFSNQYLSPPEFLLSIPKSHSLVQRANSNHKDSLSIEDTDSQFSGILEKKNHRNN